MGASPRLIYDLAGAPDVVAAMTANGEERGPLKAYSTITLFVVTAVAVVGLSVAISLDPWREWIEFLTGWDPDGGSGALEMGIVVVLAAIALGLSLRARSDWRKVKALPA